MNKLEDRRNRRKIDEKISRLQKRTRYYFVNTE